MTSITSMGRENKPVETSKTRCRFPPSGRSLTNGKDVKPFGDVTV
jgi:hypothetical protein